MPYEHAERVEGRTRRRRRSFLSKTFLLAFSGDGDDGYFRAHRDSVSHKAGEERRFALSVNLNDDFEGGRLRFNEFGPQTYCPAAGDGVVFSCKLLHEAMPVTKGRRFGLFAFFY